MRVLCDVIVIPPTAFWEKFDIPRSVREDLFWGSDTARQELQSYFGDVRALAFQCGLMNPVSRRVWRMLSIDGEATRFRSEPDRTPRVTHAA